MDVEKSTVTLKVSEATKNNRLKYSPEISFDEVLVT